MLINMSVFYALTVFFAVTTRILYLPEQTVVLTVLSKISTGCLITMIFNIIINTMMRSWVRFRDYLYKDESYLTHTLPVTKAELYESKFLQTVIFTLFGFALTVLSLLIAYYSPERWQSVKSIIDGISTGARLDSLPFVLSIVIILFLEIVNGIQAGFLGTVLGHKCNDHRVLLSVVFGFIIYLFSQSVLLLLFAVYGAFNGDIAALFSTNAVVNVAVIKRSIVFSLIVYTGIIALMNFLCVKLLQKGVNVE